MSNVWLIILTLVIIVDIIITVVNNNKVIKLSESVDLLNRNVNKMNVAEENEVRRRVGSAVESITWKLETTVENAVFNELERASVEIRKQGLEERLAAAKERKSIDSRGTA